MVLFQLTDCGLVILGVGLHACFSYFYCLFKLITDYIFKAKCNYEFNSYYDDLEIAIQAFRVSFE